MRKHRDPLETLAGALLLNQLLCLFLMTLVLAAPDPPGQSPNTRRIAAGQQQAARQADRDARHLAGKCLLHYIPLHKSGCVPRVLLVSC